VGTERDALATITVFITGGATWVVPTDYGLPSTVDCLGAGAGGSSTGGGGAGAFSRKNNLSLTPGATVNLQIGGNNPAGSPQTWFQSSAIALADGANGSAGGQAATSIGDVVFSGGAGGTAHGPGGGGGGGGGAAGQHGAGLNGGSGGAPTNGGNGDNGSGGAGGINGANGAPGTEYGTTGSGGGGGGSIYFTSGGGFWRVGNAGSYGAGGGGQQVGSSGPGGPIGTGFQGAMWITYTQTAGPPPTGLHRRVGVTVSG
jgi:hypothetical protein